MQNAKRSALIEASVQVVANCGFHGASIGSIVATAGVAVGTVYVHFGSKDHLIQETYRELERRCLEAVMKEYPSRGTILQRFSHLAHGLIHYFKLFPEEFLFADQFLSSPYRKSVSPNYLPDTEVGGILQFFREGAERQLFKEIPPAMLLAIACGPLIQVVRAHASGFLCLDEDRISRTVEASWEAVCVHRAPCAKGAAGRMGRRGEGEKGPQA